MNIDITGALFKLSLSILMLNSLGASDINFHRSTPIKIRFQVTQGGPNSNSKRLFTSLEHHLILMILLKEKIFKNDSNSGRIIILDPKQPALKVCYHRQSVINVVK